MAVESEVKAEARTTSTINDGTVVECWHDGEFYRAHVVAEGPALVRVDTAESRRSTVPRRHVHVLARTVSDVVVFKECEKSARLLHGFELLCA